MKICIISDTHSFHESVQIPEGIDVLIHCGDFSFKGEFFEVRDFVEWFKLQPAKHKILTCGNHEIGLEKKSVEELRRFTFGSEIYYLFNDDVVIDGIKFWGSPMTPRFFDWAYNVDRDKIGRYWDEIPEDTQVLITHGPPYGILDKNLEGENVGCQALLRRVKELPNLKYHFFGHLHESYGQIQIGQTLFVNASICNRQYKPANKPVIINL